jgi:hypothetical protein
MALLKVMLSPGETPGATVDLREGTRGKGPGGILEIGVGHRYRTCGTWASAPALRPPMVQSLFIRCRIDGRSGEGQTEVRRSEIQGGKRDIRAADPAALGDLYTGALIVSACTIATGVLVDCGVIRRITEFGLL